MEILLSIIFNFERRIFKMKGIKTTYKFKLSDFFIGILFLLFFISLSVIILLNTDFIYYNCIDIFDLEKSTGLPKRIIINNYRALMDYCSPFYSGTLSFPNLPSSSSGLSHFEETKILFNTMYTVFVTNLLLLSLIIFRKHRKKENDYLLTSAITILLLPCITALLTAINFDWTFTMLHKILFRNNDWLFDSRTDPIILLLPQEYFKYCAILIYLLVAFGSYLLYLFYKKMKQPATPHKVIEP